MNRQRNELIGKILDCEGGKSTNPNVQETCAQVKAQLKGNTFSPRLVHRATKQTADAQNVKREDELENARRIPQAVSALIDAGNMLVEIAQKLQRPGADLPAAIEAIATVRDNALAAALSKLTMVDETQADKAFFSGKRQTDKQFWGGR